MLLRQGIDHEAVCKRRSFGSKILLLNQVLRKVEVEFVEAFLIFGKSDVSLGSAVSEVDADHWMDAGFLRSPDKWENPGGTVDVCEGKGIKFFAFRLSDQCFHGHCPVFEAEVRVAVEEHF